MQIPKKIEFSKEIIRFQNEKTFEKILQLTPLDIECVMEIDQNFKLPLFIDFTQIKDQISFQEKSLKQAVMSGIHSLKIWEICKTLCFFYLICAAIYLTQRKFDFFVKFYKKAEYIFHPPSRDSGWQSKPEWMTCKIILAIMKASYLAKEGNLKESLEMLEMIKTERIGKMGSLLIRKIYWGLGTLYNQYKETEKAIECFKKGIEISDKEDEFHKARNKMEEENFFVIYYVYFKYKTSKLLKILKRREEAFILLKEAAANIKEISKQWQMKSKNIFDQEFMNIIGYIEKKIKKLKNDIAIKPIKQEKNQYNLNQNIINPSQRNFEEYLIKIKQKSLKTISNNQSNQNKLEKETLLKKLKRSSNSNEENIARGEYMLKDIYKSRPISPKVDIDYLKNLSQNKSKEIQKTYLMTSNYPKTSRTTTNRTMTNYTITLSNDKKQLIKNYNVLARPMIKENSLSNNSHNLKKSKTNNFSTSGPRRTSKENIEIPSNEIKDDKNSKNILKKIVGGVHYPKPEIEYGYLNAPSQEQSIFKETPKLKMKNFSNLQIKIFDEQNSGFLSENPTLTERILIKKPLKKQKTLKAIMNENIEITLKKNENINPGYLSVENREILNQEAIKEISTFEICPKKSAKKQKQNALDLFDLEEEYKILTTTDRSLFNKSKDSPRKESYKNQVFKEDIPSAHSSLRKGHTSYLRKESSDEEKKSAISNIALTFVCDLLNRKPVEQVYEYSKEEKDKQLKAMNLIRSRFKKYKMRKNMNSQKNIINTNVVGPTESDEVKNQENNIILSNKYSKTATLKKPGVIFRKTNTLGGEEDFQRNFQRRISRITVFLDSSFSLMKQSSKTHNQNAQRDSNENKVTGQYIPKIKSNYFQLSAQSKDPKFFHKLENIPRPGFFIMKFLEGRLMKFTVKIKKYSEKEKEIIINITSQTVSFDIKFPIKEKRKSGVFFEFKTLWPTVYDSFFSYLKDENLIKEEEFFSEVDSFIKPNMEKLMGFLENPIHLKSNRLTFLDIEKIGYLKMLLDVMFEKRIFLKNKSVGLALAQYPNSQNTKDIYLRKLNILITKQRKYEKTKQVKKSLNLPFKFEEMQLKYISEEIGDWACLHEQDLKLETLKELNKNPILGIFLTKDTFWKKYWLIFVSWSFDRDPLGNIFPLIKVSGFDWKQSKHESCYTIFDWERFQKKICGSVLNYNELFEEYSINYGFTRKTKKKLLERFKKSFQINNSIILVISDEEKKKTHKNERAFFKKNEIFGFDLLNLKVPKITIAKHEFLFKKGFDEIYSRFFEDKREYLDEEKDKDLTKLIKLEDLDDYLFEKHFNNKKIIVDDAEEKSFRKRSLRFFRIERQNTFYAYLKNFIKEHKLLKLYFKLSKTFELLHLKLQFLFDDDIDFVQIRLNIYEPFRRINFFYHINDLKDIILMTNILLVNNPKIKHIQLKQIIKNILQPNGFRLKCKDETTLDKKLIYNEYSLKAFVLNNFLKNTNFYENSLVFLENLEHIGKSIIFIKTYENKQPTNDNRLLFSIKILDLFSKIKRFKLILSIDDINAHFSTYSHYFTQKISFHQMKYIFSKILNKFSLEKLFLYSSLVYSPNNSSKNFNRFEKRRKVRNCFNEKRGIPIFPKRNNGFLEEFIQDSRTIIKIIKKHQGNFYFLTILKNLLMNYWILMVYIPKSSRSFMAYLNNNEILKFSVDDLSNAFKKNMHEYIEEPIVYKNFTEFKKKINDIENDLFPNTLQKKNINILTTKNTEEKRQSLQLPESPKQAKRKSLQLMNEHFKKALLVNKFTSKRMRKMLKIKALMYLTKKIDNFKGKNQVKKMLSFCEIEFWYNLLENIEISAEKSQRFELKQGEFVIKMKEILYNKYVKVDNYNEAFIDIFFVFLHDNPSVFATLDSIHYAYSMNYNFVIKYLSLNRMNIQIDSINLRELINIYISDGFYKHPTSYMYSKLLMSDVKDLCNFLIYKIKSSNFCNFLHNANANENLIKRRKMHANENIAYLKNIEIEAKKEDEKLNIMTFISKTKPLSVVKAIALLSSHKIVISVYNRRKSDIFIKEFKFSVLKKKNGFFKELIRFGEWKIIVDRLWAIMEKEIIIEAEFNFKFNEY